MKKVEEKNEIKTFYSKDWPSEKVGEQDYELLDTGEHQKLERFGKYIFIRPHEDAFWEKTLPKEEWDKADGVFFASRKSSETKGGWKLGKEIDLSWDMSYKDIKFSVSPTPFRHMRFFPEQATHWDFIEKKIKESKRKIKFFNLFGYTGIASLFALRAGAEVTHLDASEQTITWLKENQELSGLEGLPMRVIVDDALKFIEREIRRGNKYDAIVMDPPKFGRGPKGEIWKIEENLPKLLSQINKILSDDPLFVIITSYAIDSSSLSLGYALKDMMKNHTGIVEQGELGILEKSNNRIIPLANTAIWEKN
ncbi:MAG: SAM-dependent methyltransferase [Candidatus Nomurabacteria bacterium GW2011_GWE1_32_28]|uniref:SAM-dependent methyltransferase n=1 Tax=Candidatus Nomurabacteria bacterium GW2011_GWF1_31_48 TaxID=1618767 RepID=A0A0F9YUI1_9BACT|nr:MAG: SAM-dependent methyltransferase [Candidatus Nomurabacteria bacterium GW2011_GWF2_30_133]KKP28501.1 MAG: SAM-dependent methyltransferase [Candidatus Nomurabacteria bacterium GW2011_GWE2_31_40]KKP30096.1 MAG: SAM-dependent methyltransferase [Candidatus Nomurabacteria bacterium GW2011_GWF1_31_48]KKP34641.1 MAG: SAM-dependent methyltransferase [Candidatus Nomurabacteria bacterium GW2011_GWE1_32_28]HAS80897.1 SAM-dependent methyltransferase [Candidatus Nomurabacteria bacterium]